MTAYLFVNLPNKLLLLLIKALARLSEDQEDWFFARALVNRLSR